MVLQFPSCLHIYTCIYYINGINIDVKHVSILLYADAIVLIHDCDSLFSWFGDDDMVVNLDQCKIVHFRRGPQTTQTNYNFTFGNPTVDIVQVFGTSHQ